MSCVLLILDRGHNTDNQHMHIYKHTYIHAYMHTYIHTYIHTYVLVLMLRRGRRPALHHRRGFPCAERMPLRRGRLVAWYIYIYIYIHTHM